MHISNEELFQIDQINSYTQNKTFLPTENLQRILDAVKDFKSGSKLPRDSDLFGDLYDDIQGFAMSANNRYFRYDIQGFQPIEYVEYTVDSKLQSQYLDCRPIPEHPSDYRKLSFIVQLNIDYEGGEFEMFRSNDKYSMVEKNLGGLVVYSSFTPYRLQPVTQGRRRVLQGYIYGSRFR